LWILDLDRGDHRILSSEPYIESPAISMDGTTIAYSLVHGFGNEGNQQVWTIDADSSENTLVADNTGQFITDPGPFRLVPVAWSADKSKIYMTTTTDSEATPVGMYVADVATGNIEKALTPQVTLWDLAFSPDRTMVAYRTFQWLPVEGSMPEAGPPFTLQVTDLATGGTRVLQESDTLEYYHPVWSPDGGHIAYSARSAQPAEEIGLFTLDLATGIATRLVPGSQGRQLRPWAWLGADRLVYSEAGGASEYGGDPAMTLHTIKTDGSEQHVVETAGAMFVLGTLDGPAWARSRVHDAQLVSAGLGPGWGALAVDR
jgi:Tol biopolymer transport system component